MTHRIPRALVAVFVSLAVATFIFGLTGALPASSLPRRGSVQSGADVETAPLVAGESIVAIANESFEGTFPPTGWSASGHWGRSNCQKSVGSFSAWVEGTAGLSCSSVYHSNEQSTLTFGPFDLGDAISATLEFDLWLWSSQGDTFFWGASIDGVNFHGNSLVDAFETLWGARSLDLSAVPTLGDLRGESNVWIRFAWSTDDFAEAFDGAYVDNVQITKRAVPRVDVVKRADRAAVGLGGSITYTIAITSTGLADTAGVRLTDTLSLNLALAGGPIASAGKVGAVGQTITWTGPISIGQGVRITYITSLTGMPPDGTPLINAISVYDGAGKVFAAVPVTVAVSWPHVYLPVTFRNAGPPPAPVLNSISNPGGVGSYTVSWSAATGATTYTLVEDDSASFTSPTTIYSGSGTSKSVGGRAMGTYYYRVKASNFFGDSAWSNVESVVVSVPPPACPNTGSWSGTTNQAYSVSFGISTASGCHATSLNIRYRVSCAFGSLTKSTTFLSPISISNNHFDTGGIDPRVVGNFSSPSAASGTWNSSFYDAILGWCTGSGTWTASGP